jgi:hypothetical protein
LHAEQDRLFRQIIAVLTEEGRRGRQDEGSSGSPDR